MKKVILLVAAFIMVLGLAACGGEDPTVTIYTRDTTSGTRAGFMDGIGFDEAAEEDNVLAEGFVTADNTGIFEAMKTDEYGIGYISLATYESNASAVKGLSFNGVAPTTANVVNNTYGLKRPFNYVLRDLEDYATDAERDISVAFIAFLHTTDGADVIATKKGVPLASTESWDDIKDQYPICAPGVDNSGVTIKFGGSDSIQKIAEALSAEFAPKCGNFVPEHDHTGSSDGYKRTLGEQKDTDSAKHIGFASRPFKTDGSEDFDDNDVHGQLAWDAIVAIVHNDNELADVDALLLKKIYAGDLTTWAEVMAEVEE